MTASQCLMTPSRRDVLLTLTADVIGVMMAVTMSPGTLSELAAWDFFLSDISFLNIEVGEVFLSILFWLHGVFMVNKLCKTQQVPGKAPT